MSAISKIAAMIFSSPPQFGQCLRSSSNTRVSSRAELMLAGSPNRLSAAGGGRLFVAENVGSLSAFPLDARSRSNRAGRRRRRQFRRTTVK